MLRICEIFSSLQGEGLAMGRPCTFIRLGGCDLDCAYCDTRYAHGGGNERGIPSILEEVRSFRIELVEVTGGEPLLQEDTPALLRALLDEGFEVLLETSGSRCVELLPEGVHVICDLKSPSSGMEGRNHYANLEHLGPGDELKLVLMNRTDFDWARDLLRESGVAERIPVSLQAAAGHLEARRLADWILAERLPVRLGVQLHKWLWPEDDRGR